MKAHLSAELKRVSAGTSLTVLDHRRPVARLCPLPSGLEYFKRRSCAYEYRPLKPLMAADPLVYLDEERGDR